MEQPEQLPVDDMTDEPVESTGERREVDKPDYVKRIEGFDIHNLAPEDIEYMTRTIQDYFLENFPVDPELVEQLPERINILSTEEFMRMIEEEEGDDNKCGFSLIDPSGFYDEKLDRILINGPTHETPGGLFATMFHECLHCISIENGAGLIGNFGWPDAIYEDKVARSDAYKGINTLNEGTTQIITLRSIIDKMGFDEQTEMLGYPPEIEIMRAIWRPIPYDEMLDAYFNRKMDEIRMHIERVFEPEETRDEIKPTGGNGVFALCLCDLGITTSRMYEVMENWDDRGDWDAVLNDVCHAVGSYIIQRHNMDGTEITAEEKEAFHEYLKPYEDPENREEEDA